MTLLFIMVGCSKDDEPTAEDSYYVKYEWQMSSQHSNIDKEISFITENGKQTFTTQSYSWEGTYGPLKKGTKVYLNCICKSPSEYSYSQTNNHARIYISRNKEPFVIKAEKEGKRNITLIYTIDF